METEQHGDFEKIQKANLKRARIIAITFAVIAGLAIISLVYAFVQQGIAKENVRVAIELQKKLESCEQEASKQKKMAEANAAEANRQRNMIIQAMSKIKK